MLKRVSAVLLTVAMLLSMVCTFSVVSADPAADAAALSITADREAVERGDDVIFTIKLVNQTVDLTGLAIEVVVDDEVLGYKEKGWLLTEGKLVDPAADNQFAWASDSALAIPADGGLCTITYTALEDAVLGDTVIEVNALEASDNGEGADVADVTITSGSLTLEVECAHDYTDALPVSPAAGTSYEEAQHTYECIYDDCDEVTYEVCDFEWSEEGSFAHTDEEDGQDIYVCTVCDYECVEVIPAGHETLLFYTAATATEDGEWCETCYICFEDVEVTPITAGHPGKDVTKPTSGSQWYYNYAQYCKATGLMVGDTAGNFNPAKDVTRGQFASIVARIYYGGNENIPTYTNAELTLTDIKGKWYRHAAQAMFEVGIVSGYEQNDGTFMFKGDNNITREAAVSLVHRLFVEMYGEDAEISFGPESSPADMNKVSSWAKADVEWATATGLVAGNAAGNFNPKNNIKRQEMAVILTKYDAATRGVIVLSPEALAEALGQNFILG